MMLYLDKTSVLYRYKKWGMVPEGFRITGKYQERFLKVSGQPESTRNGS